MAHGFLHFWCIVVINCVYFLQQSAPITVTTDQNGVHFPLYRPNPKNPLTFLRVEGESVEVIACPLGYHFDARRTLCAPRRSIQSRLGDGPGPGQWANPDSCGSFFNCDDTRCFLQNCGEGTVFSNATRRCEWPLKADCCEHRAKNPNRLVQ